MLTDQLNHYQHQGYVVIPGLFTADELDRLERSFDGIVERRLAAGDQLDATWRGDRWRERQGAQATVVLHTHDLQAHSAEWTRALTSERLTAAMSALMASRAPSD